MSGAAMGLTSAARGFIVFLLSVQVIQGQDDWGVTYTSPQICALKGTTVEIRCSYRYPSRLNEGDTTAERTFWTTDRRLVDLRLDSNYTGRVQHHCDKRDCALRIRDVRESDSAEFNFRFITQSNSYTGSPGVRLTVTGFQVQMSRIQSCNIGACTYAELNCHSRCPLTDRPSYIWYKNGQKMDKVEKPFYHYFYAADSYSCAVTGHKDVPSRSVCVHGQSCNRVTYDDRNICAFKGSTVNISCNYNSYESIKTKFWFRFDQSGYNTRPKDLSKDPQYAGRVLVFENERGRRSILRISDLRERDSAEYHFKFTTGNYEWESSLPGTTLTVTDPDLQVQVIWSPAGPKLICHSSCLLVGRSSFVWYKNDTIIFGETYFSYGGKVDPADSYSCAHEGHRSPSVYAPKRPSVSVNHSAEIEEGGSVTLSCSSDANPAANYSWYKENQTLLSKKPQLVFSSIQSSDYGQYCCVAENELGRRTSTYVFVNVKYAPKRPSVSVSPSAEIEEGSSVTLNCSSDANPAANYTWYKENQTLVHGPEGIYRLTSISSEDRGNYFCKSENQYGQINSSSQYLDVKYAPKRPSVSVSPSEIEEGSSVTLTCSSDANPAANYTWYKEDEDSPKASGQIFTITEFRAEDSGNYYCEAENNRGRRNSTLRLITVAGAWKSAAVGILTFLLVALIGLLVVFFLMKRSKSRRQQSDGGERSGVNRAQLNMGPVSDTTSAAAQRQPAEQQDELQYASISFAQRQEDALYSNIRPAQTQRHTEDEDDEVEYTSIKPDSSASGARRQENGEDLFALYSTVTK